MTTDWPRIVLAHGFTQNARCWGPFGRRLGARYGTVAVDAPGHGQSVHDEADLHEAGHLLIEAGGPGHYLGYSMGGRMLLHGVLGDDISAVRSIVLIGATAGIEDEAERSERALRDERLAQEIRKVGTPEFIERWLANPLFEGLDDESACKVRRLENSPDGMAASLVHCGTGSQEPLWSRLSEIEIPVLVIAGTRDTKFTNLGRRMADEIGDNARFLSVEGGHAVHLEQPAATADVILAWMDQVTS
ncbi:MAG: alpha/beta fold hydrolase [Actinomycetota bacterium]